MKSFMNKRIVISLMFCALAMLFIGTGCSSKKSMTKASLREFTANRLIKEVEKNNFDFNDIQAKLSVKLEVNDEKHTVKGQLRMKKDSIVWISASLPLGLEIVRLMITDDSVFFLNRNEKTYLAENIMAFSDISPMIASIQFIQSVLVGNDINLRDNDRYKVSIDNNQYNLLISKELKKSIKHSDVDWKVMMKDVWIDPELFKITKYYIKEYNDNKRKIELEYSDFELVGEKYLPTRIDLNIRGDVSLKASITYSNINMGDKIEFNFKIPKKYDRIYK
jgi:hypothetical protein